MAKAKCCREMPLSLGLVMDFCEAFCMHPLALKLSRVCMRLIGYLCVCVALGLISTTMYKYFSVVFPLVANPHSPLGFLNFLVSAWFSFNLWFNYVMVLTTKPGSPVGRLTEQERVEMLAEEAPQKGRGWTRFCKRCELPKPPRAHHCHMCNRCVLKMDHHCPWINGCVGHHNHRYFFLFCFWLLVSCLWCTVMCTLWYFDVASSGNFTRRQQRGSVTALLFTFAVCAALSVAISLFVGWNSVLVATNQTTIEFSMNRTTLIGRRLHGEVHRNPYDLGTKRNLALVFGPFTKLWQIVLPSVDRLPTDGEKWPTLTNPMDFV